MDFDQLLDDMPSDFVSNDVAGDAFDEDQNGLHLNPDDFRRAADVQDEDPLLLEGEDPIELAGAFEGDIVNISKVDIAEMRVRALSFTRNAIRNKNMLWPNCEVPYVISSQYGSYERGVIASAFQEYHEKTCIKYDTLFICIFDGFRTRLCYFQVCAKNQPT